MTEPSSTHAPVPEPLPPTVPARAAPSWRSVRDLVRLRRPTLDRVEARLRRCFDIADLRAAALRTTPRLVFDYVDGGADAEIGLQRNRRAYRDIELNPAVLQDVSTVDTSTTVGGHPSRLPFGIAPIGLTRLMHTAGERAGARVAADAGIPFCLGTMGTTSMEDLADAAPAADRWFQLYLWRDREASLALVNRAWAAGFRTLVFTVDTPVGGNRLRDARNGMTIPPSLGVKEVADAALRPRWWFDFLTTAPLAYSAGGTYSGSVADTINVMFDPSMTEEAVAWLRSQWPGHLVVKGIQRAEDAVRVVDAGADAVWLSGHGGRQLDRGPVLLRVLPEVRAALAGRDPARSAGSPEVYVDTGVLSGTDVAIALASGADFVFVGRAYLYGLMAGGERGARRAVEILAAELTRTMQLLGVRTIDELGPGCLRSVIDDSSRTHRERERD